MDSKSVIKEIADKNLTYIMNHGHAQPGHNGPYNNEDTPVRNSAHWIITYSWLWEETGDEKYSEAVCLLASYLMDSGNYGSSGSIICRTDKRFDSTNGLIGQAWVIEGLVRAAKMLQNAAFVNSLSREAIEGLGSKDLLQKAHALFKVQKFDRKSKSWNIIDCDGSVDFDQTYNHQLWFAASGAMLLEYIEDVEIDAEIKAFLTASDETLFQVQKSGLIIHGLNRHLTDEEKKYQVRLNDNRKKRDFLHNPFAVIKRKLDRRRSKYSFTYKLEEGYHLFDLYGFALLKNRYGDMPIFKSEKLKKAIEYAFSSDMIDSLSERTGEYAYNKFAYGYNSPAFEYPFVAAVFGEDDADLLPKAEKLFNEQCRLTYDEQNKTFLRSPDPGTLDARIYELARYFELRDTKNNHNDWMARDKQTAENAPEKGNSKNDSNVEKQKICFMTEGIYELGGRQRITAILVNALAENPNLDITLFYTARRTKAEKQVYQISGKVRVLIDEDISGRAKRYLPYKAFRFLNKKVLHIGNANYLKKIYFPMDEVKKYQRFFAKHHFDVVVGIGTRQAAMLSMCFRDKDSSRSYPAGNSPKLIAWYHTPWNVYFRTHGIFQWRQEELYKYLLPKLDLHIVLTKGEQKRYQKELGDASVEYIYNPLTFQSKKKSVLAGNKLVFVGRLDYNLKGLDYLAEVFRAVKVSIPDAELTVVGDGSGRGHFEEQIKSMSLESTVHMVGASNDVKKYYLDSSICLVTSRQEGFGLVVTEAMECGVPVVSFKTEGPSEIIEDGISGYLVDKFDTGTFAERVIALCKNADKKAEIGRGAIKRAKEFSVDAVMTRWIEAFR